MRSNVRDAATGLSLQASRATLKEADDSKPKQELKLRVVHDEEHEDVEHFHAYGFSAVPMKPEDGSKEAAEAVILYMGAHRSHPVAVVVADKRHRPKDLKPGESALHGVLGSDGKQQRVHVQENGVRHGVKAHSVNVDDGIAKHRIQPNGFHIIETNDVAKLRYIINGVYFALSPAALVPSTKPPDDPTRA